MIRPAGHLQFLSLARRVGGTDANIAKILGVSASTMSRLRSGKIQKLGQYSDRLRAHVGSAEPFDEVLIDLGQWASSSAELRRMLFALHAIVQESA